jgi:hypothetical protein
MTERRMVIYREHSNWGGAVEYKSGWGPFKKIDHAPITHADSAAEVFAWLLERYPDRVIAYDPSVSERYRSGTL